MNADRVGSILAAAVAQMVIYSVVNGLLWLVDSPWRFWWYKS